MKIGDKKGVGRSPRSPMKKGLPRSVAASGFGRARGGAPLALSSRGRRDGGNCQMKSGPRSPRPLPGRDWSFEHQSRQMSRHRLKGGIWGAPYRTLFVAVPLYGFLTCGAIALCSNPPHCRGCRLRGSTCLQVGGLKAPRLPPTFFVWCRITTGYVLQKYCMRVETKGRGGLLAPDLQIAAAAKTAAPTVGRVRAKSNRAAREEAVQGYGDEQGAIGSAPDTAF